MKNKSKKIILTLVGLVIPLAPSVSLGERSYRGSNNSPLSEKLLANELKTGYFSKLELRVVKFSKTAQKKLRNNLAGRLRNISPCNFSPTIVASNLESFPSAKNFILRNATYNIEEYSQTYEEANLYFKLNCPNYKF